MRRKQTINNVGTNSFRIFNDNLLNITWFLATTENYYSRRVNKLRLRLRRSQSELPEIVKELDKLVSGIGTRKPTKVEENRIAELDDKVYELSDDHFVIPMLVGQFRQYPDLVRILGLIYLVTIYEGYLSDIKQEISSVRHDLNRREFKAICKQPKKIIEITRTRNIHIHNKGIIDEKYLNLVRDNKWKDGMYKKITRKYLRDSIDSIRAHVEFIEGEVKRLYFEN